MRVFRVALGLALATAGSSFAQASGNPTGMDQRYAPTLPPGASSSYEHSPRSAFFLPPADRRDSSLRITASHLEFGCQERMWGRPSCRRADRPNRRRSRRVGRTVAKHRPHRTGRVHPKDEGRARGLPAVNVSPARPARSSLRFQNGSFWSRYPQSTAFAVSILRVFIVASIRSIPGDRMKRPRFSWTIGLKKL